MSISRRHILLALVFAPAALRAQEAPLVFEGLRFERRVRVAGTELLLNGTGLRAVAWFKGFAAALYLGSKAAVAAQAVTMAGPKRLQLRMLHDVPSAEFSKAFRKGITRNTDAADLPRLEERMQQFEALVNGIGTVRKGDTVDLDLEPGRGTLFSLNGTLRGELIAGDDFYAALLRSFLGDKPYDNRLKAGLLGRPA